MQKGFRETVAEVMDAEAEGEDEIHPSQRARVAERVPIHVPSEVEPQSLDFDVDKFVRSSQNSVVASVSGESGLTENERQSWCFLWKISWAPRAGINLLRGAPFVFEDTSHLCMFGVKDPRSRRALKRPVRYLANSRQLLRFVVRKCPNKHVH